MRYIHIQLSKDSSQYMTQFHGKKYTVLKMSLNSFKIHNCLHHLMFCKWYSRIAKCMNACLPRILLWKVHSSNCVLCLAWNFCSSTHHFLRHPDTWLALKKLLNLEKVGMMMTSCFLFDSTVQSIILGASVCTL